MTDEQGQELNPLKRALFALKDMRAKLDAVEQAKTEPIAIVGMACRFPGEADTPDAYWQLLRDGLNAVREVPPERWDIDAYYDPDPDAPGKMSTRWGGFLDAVDSFDPQFFGITPREAMSMDPQQRLLLEVAWETLERAGIPPDQLTGSRTGVFVGISSNEYQRLGMETRGLAEIDAYVGTGGATSVATGRISYVLGLRGPNLAVDTACSSSLVAIHLAVQSLRAGQCDAALAGGVNLMLSPEATIVLSKVRALSPDSRCKTFDAAADGYVRSEGCGMVALKRLSDALAAGDPIVALIRGSAINHDGRSSGLTVPNGSAQQEVIRAALADAGDLDPLRVGFVEAHGTGTPLGDPIEVRALVAVLGKGRPADRPILLGSIKTNIGHMETAAGIAGLIKVALSLHHRELPPHLHLREPSPHIAWDELPIHVVTERTPWAGEGGPLVAGVNSFGLSGTNAHILLEEAPAQAPAPAAAPRPRHILTLSAKGEAALRAAAARLAGHLTAHPELDIADVCHTANTSRSHFGHRLAVVAANPEDLQGRLQAFAQDGNAPGAASGRASAAQPKVAFLFTGQGAQYAGMGRGLYAAEPVFLAALDRCAELLAPHLDLSLLDLLYGEAADKIDQTAYTQPALFAIEYALSELWRSWGVTPSAVLGHSVGEYVAAVVAGVLSLEDGLRLIAARGRLMQSLPAGGAMAAIFAPAERVQAAVAPHAAALAVAAINGPEHTVISGEAAAVESVMEQFGAAGVRVQRLTVSHAFHSPLMNPILDQFERVAAGVPLSPPSIPLISNLSGAVAGDEVTTPAYWRRHLREAVRFGAGAEALRAIGADALVEIGPHPTLLGMAQQVLSGESAALGLPSLRKGRDDSQQILESLGQLYVRGATIAWAAQGQGRSPRKVELPTYPFQRQRYWLLPPPARPRRPEAGHGGHPLLGRRTRSPLLRETLFESEVSAAEPAFLADHSVFDSVVFPGAAYLELALAAAATVGTAPLNVTSLSIQEPLRLDESPYILQLVLTPEDDGAHALQIVGFRPEDPASARTHAAGLVRAGDSGAARARADLAALRAACPEPISTEEYYAALAEKGLGYGPAFRGLTELWRGQGGAIGLVRLPAAAGSAAAFQLHPALLDACFHVIGAAVPVGDAGVPVAFSGLRLFRPAATAVWCYAEPIAASAASPQALSCRLLLLDEAGEAVAEIERLEVMRAPRDAWGADPVAAWFHQLTWRPQTREAAAPPAARRWLILANAADQADKLARLLAGQGATVTAVLPGPSTAEHEPGRWQASLRDPLAFDPILTAAGPLDGVACLWAGPDADGLTLADLAARQEIACAGTLHLVQALARSPGEAPRLWVVTRGTQAADAADPPVAIADATLWGLGKVVALEHPGLRCTLVDLDPASESLDQLAGELLTPDREDQIALRGGVRLAARLSRRVGAGMALPAGAPYRLALPERGMLDRLVYEPLEPRVPGSGEVAVTVHATGLNFRDVLNVLGMYPGDPGPPGLECAGVVSAVGPGLTGLAVGDAVMGLATRGFDSVVVVRAELLARKPAGLSFTEAATIPTAFLTAYYGLRTLADLRPGERVLIHAAAGGVGLAAVQIAQQVGAEVFATAGSPAKHAHLRGLGVRHIFSSRTADFRAGLMAATGGRGVDVVLNSLSDDFIGESFAALAPGGRFLEIGKRGIWTAEQAAVARPDVRYMPYVLGEMLIDAPAQLKAMLEDVLAGMADGTLAPLPLRAFPAEAAVEAFRYMSQAKHIGKVVVTHRPATWAGPASSDGAYLITGGMGGLGLRVAGWLAERGARHVALLGRRAPSPEAGAAIAALREAGVEVQILAADVASPADVDRALAAISATGRPLRGVFHAAGSLDDGVLPQQCWERFARVFAPKLAGAWNLHLATRSAPLDHFVLFSSASALLGNPGQANYAAANAFLDALAHQRRAAGLPGISVNWGPWAEVGMAATLDAGHQGQMAGRGVSLIPPEKGLLALERALVNGDAQTAVLPIRWSTLLDQFPAGQAPPLFAEFAQAARTRKSSPASPGDDAVAFRQRLVAAAGDERQRMLVERLTLHVARVMGLDVRAADPSRSLSDLGIDSLMAVELKNRIDRDLRGNVPVTSLLAGPSIEQLAADLAGRFVCPPEAAAAPAPADTRAASPDQILANLDQLSDDDVDAMLNAMLNDQGTAE